MADRAWIIDGREENGGVLAFQGAIIKTLSLEAGQRGIRTVIKCGGSMHCK